MNSRSFIAGFIIPAFLLLLPSLQADGQISFQQGSPFRYLKGRDASGLPSVWMQPAYNDLGWSQGSAPFRYGDGSGGTLLEDMQNNYSVVYMRTTFQASGIDQLGPVSVSIDYDDGFAIWINGEQVLEKNSPASLAYNGFATTLHESGQAEVFVLEPGSYELKEGENTLAIQGFNFTLESTDFFLDLSLQAHLAEKVLEDSIGMGFSVPPGFYQAPFMLEITPSDSTWEVVYTIDGSNPQDSPTAIAGGDRATIMVDPESQDGRPRTPVFIVRACSFVEGMKPSFPESRSYIFLDEVMDQIDPGGGWPTEPVNSQVIDLDMDQRVVLSSEYKDDMVTAMTEVPTISIITSLDNLFDPATGIYVNASRHGMEWERECSVELLYPDGSDGFNVNAGLRIRGGWSRHPEFPKHAFRLFFRSEYGDAKLRYPLFGEEGVDRFDKIDLRCAQNYAWSQGDGNHTFLRDVFSRDLQRDMGQPYTRSRYYHLYLNGMYWGLYQTQERSEARYAADYFGGESEDYDVVKVDTENYRYQIEASDGNLDAWNRIWEMCGMGFSENANYFELTGRDQAGDPVAGGRVYVDLDNLIDYMLSIFFTGNFDAPTSSFGSNKGPNNFYAVLDREDASSGFVFFNHDAEHSLFAEAISPGIGLNENRVNLGTRTGSMKMDVTQFGSFHPQWLHHKLTGNAEYRTMFMDRANLHLGTGGALTRGENLDRLNSRASEFDMAIIGESARWGDARSWVTWPFTKNDDWIPKVNSIRNNYFPYRNDIVIEQLENAGLWSTLDPPRFFLNGLAVQDREIPVTGPVVLKIRNTNPAGTLWYSTDGSDPRSIGGTIAPDALAGSASGIDLDFNSSALVRARVLSGNEWSALNEVRILAAQADYSGLVVTELNYHPLELVVKGDTLQSKDLEYIEFKNISSEAINLTGLVIDSGIYYAFPDNELLPPSQFYVIASKPSAFYMRYGMDPSGNFDRNLSNGGDEIQLRDKGGNLLIHFIYSDQSPWPFEADGTGYSLVSAIHDPDSDPAFYDYWKHSAYLGGSPFKNDPYPLSAGGREIPDSEVLVYPNPTSGLLNVRWQEGEWPSGTGCWLYDLNGILIHTVELQGDGLLNLEPLGLAPGVYLLKVEVGRQTFMKKVIYR